MFLCPSNRLRGQRAYDEGDAEGIAEYEARRDKLKNTGYGWELEDAAAQMANAKSGLTNGQGKALDMLNMGATLLGEATINGVGGNKLFRFGSSLSAAGRATRDTAQDGASARDQLTYDNMIGGINYAVEVMGGIAGNGLAGKVTGKVLPEGARTALAKAGNSTLGKIAGNFFEEGMEEVIQGEAERHAGNILLGRDQKFDAGEAANSFLMGGTMGGLFGAAQAGMQASF